MRRALFCAAWGFSAGLLYSSFFGKLVAPAEVDSGNWNMSVLTVLVWSRVCDVSGRHGGVDCDTRALGAYRVGDVRWIVDAMNVIGSRPDGWWKNRRDAMVRLVDQLEEWASAEGHRVTVVFEHPTKPPIRSSVVDVEHAPKAAANSADDEIVRLVRADDRPQEIIVVTSDSALVDRVRTAGASTYPAAGFRDLVDPPP